MNKFKFACIIFFFFNIACKRNSPNSGYLTIPQESQDPILISSLFEEVEIIPIAGDPAFFPNELDKAMVSDQFIVVGDFTYSQSLYVFEKESWEIVPIPLRKGEGPNEAKEVSDFWIANDFLYILDGVGRKILPMKIEEGSFILQNPVPLEVPLRKFAKTESGFVGLTGGGQDFALAFVNGNGKVTSTHLPFSIEYLMNPMNPFHQVNDGNLSMVLLHTQFSPLIYRVDQDELVEFKRFAFGSEPLKIHEKTDYRLDQEGFDQFRTTLQSQPSFFTLFEKTANQFLLFHIINEVPKMALVDGDFGLSFRFQNFKNDISFDQPFPKVIGVNEDRFLAFVSRDQINHSMPEFKNSDLKSVIESNPEALGFLIQFKLKVDGSTSN
ncbi:6-bladed beta-propeller [Algoriphagus mannitolivorans]|uniref:6-bladed beta-propeller n=1 Tax=Algoriphagus mannitolivorans TaxID=226504 RepID=UPI0004032F26|nr:6-bladed beta-propeller [Algoriphagus mannitolivorans]